MSFTLGNGCFTILFDGGYFLLAVMVEGDESSWLRMANQPSSFRQLLALIDSPEITLCVIQAVRQVHHLKSVLLC